jgi:hypothetical protein
MRADTMRQVAGRQSSRLAGLGAILLTLGTLVFSSEAGATIDQLSSPTAAANAASPPAETGGNRVIGPGPFQLACMQNGTKLVEGRRIEQIAVSPFSLIGSLSFRRSGDSGRSIILPLGDGLTICVLSQEQQYLKRAAAAFERAIVTNRITTWASARSEAHGRVVPFRSFGDSRGRTCREFTHSITIAGDSDIATGIACRDGSGPWRLDP